MLTGLKLSNYFPIRIFYFSLFFVGFVFFSSILFVPYLPHNLRIKEGDIASKTIISPKTLEVETTADRDASQKLKRRHFSGPLEQVYTVDETITRQIMADIHEIFLLFRGLQSSDLSALSSIPEELNFLPKEKLELILKNDDRGLRTLEFFTVQCAETLLAGGLLSIEQLSISKILDSRLDVWGLPRSVKEVSYLILMHYLKPNLVLDLVKTKRLEKELNRVSTGTLVREGQPIVYKGEAITKTHLEIFQALGLLGNEFNWMLLLGISFLVAFLFVFLERFVFYFNPRIHADLKYMLVIFVLMFFGILTALFVQFLGPLPFMIEHKFLIPIPIIAMMISLTLRTNISMLAGTIMSMLIAIMFRMDLSVFLYLFLSNSITLFAAYKKYSRRELISSGYLVGAINTVIVVCIGLLTEHSSLLWYVSNGLVGFGSGIFSAMVSLAILPYFEAVFNITTRQTLMDLANLNHPLLKQLMVSAPGTYQHSMMVANLAEAAAEVTYADPMLCRVGAYFHDIGKLKRPQFFTENQLSGESPHVGLTPRMSKMIISSHVKDGLELATKYRLPDSVKNIIAMHHGTTLVSFFYIQALHQHTDKESVASKDEFRYAGPKPQSKEAGIVMLADSAEAATRSLEKPTYSKVENMVEKIFRDKIDDHQLDECPLSLREIELVKETFLKIFKGIYHTRLDYQEELSTILAQSSKKDS